MTSRLAPHCLTGTPDALTMVRAGSPVIKLVSGALGMAAECLAINPDITIIGRVYTPVTALGELMSGKSPEQAAYDFVNSQLDTYRANPLIKIYEGHNEFSCGGPDEIGALDKMKWFGQHEAERVRIMAGLGYRCTVGSFSAGYPEINSGDLRMWGAFLPAIRAAKQYNGLLSLHEYAAPFMWWYTGSFQSGNCDPASWHFPGGSLGDMGWLTLRYRQIYRYALVPTGLGDVSLVITECGNDRAGGGCPDMPTGAWRDMIQYWSQWSGVSDPVDYWRGSERDPERYYVEQLKWYDSELRKDAYVLGATIFTVGTDNPTWNAYDLSGTRVIQYLSDYIRAEATNSNPTNPPPAPIPIPQETSMINFADIYEWDMQSGAPEPGNTIQIPKGMDFAYVYDKNVRVNWVDIKVGSPTYGQSRTSDNPFLKPEVMPKTQEQMPDIPFPIGVSSLSKCFKGYGPMWVLYIATLETVIGSKYKVTWPMRPELVASYNGSVKVYADDPAAGWIRLRVKAGNVAMTIDPTKPLNSSWYNGRDFAYGYWFTPQVVVDATSTAMKVGLEFMCPFGLLDDDLMVVPPVVELVSSGGSVEPPPVPVNVAGTLRGLTGAVLLSAQQAKAGVDAVENAANALSVLVG